MKKLFFLFLVAFVFVGCKPTVGVDNPVDEPVVTPTPVVEDPWTLAVVDETDTYCSVSYIYVPKGWNPADFDKNVYKNFSGRSEENFDFLKFEKVGTLTFNSTDEEVIKADSTFIFSKINYYRDRTPDEYFTKIDCYKVSVNKDFDLDYICMVYDDLNCYNHLMSRYERFITGYSLEKDENGTWYLYTCMYDKYYQVVANRANKNEDPEPKYPKMAIANYN